MIVKELSNPELADLLTGDGLAVHMGPFVLRLRTSLPELIEPIHLLYANYKRVREDAFIDFDVRIDPGSRWQKWFTRNVTFFVDEEPQFQPFERKLALPMLEWVVNWCVFTRPNQFLILHSGVVERRGRALLLPGRPGAGKSTLCAALTLRGWRLLSDEVAVLRPGTNELIPVPRPIGLKEQSIDVIRAFEPNVALGPSTPDTRKGTVAHIQPDEIATSRGRVPAAPGLIVFPTWEAGVGLSLEPLSKARTLLHVAQDAFNFSTLGEDGFETLADLVEASDCYTLRYSRLDDAIAQLNALMDATEEIESNESRATAARVATTARATG